MGNCLVTKLKAVVDNPNLPIFETMQQFTLDAIAASGNTSMTDAQKWALNHFFIKIGAISNSGVYTKLQVIGLPFIGSSLNTAVINYKEGGPSASNISNTVSFSEQGITASGGNTNICKYTITGNGKTMFGLLACLSLSQINTEGSGRTNTFTYNNGTKNVNISVEPRTTYSTALGGNFDSSFTPKVLSYNITTDNGKLLGANNTNVVSPLENTMTRHLSEIVDGNLAEIRPSTRSGSLIYGYVYGNGLTDDEATAFTVAYRDLMYSFISE